MSVKKLSDSTIIDQVIAARRESLEARRTKDAWSRRAWSMYNNQHDWTNKEDWQSRIELPKFAMAIDQAENFLRDGLNKSTRLFGIEVLNSDPIDKLLAQFLGAIMHEVIRQMKLTRMLPGGMKVGLITNQVVYKTGFKHEEHIEIAPVMTKREVDVTDPESGIVIGREVVENIETQEVMTNISLPTVRLINPLMYYPDPRGLDLYEIEDVKQDLWQVLETFSGLTPKKILRELEQSVGKGEIGSADEQHEIDTRDLADIIEPENSFRKIVKLTDYYGPLFTRDGKLVANRVRVVLANDKHILVRGEPYPFWDGERPFTKYQGISVPFSVWGKLLVQHVDSIQFYINELASLMLDKAKLSALSPMAVDVTLLDDIEDILSGMFPGKLFKTRGPNAVQELNMSGVSADNFSMENFLLQQAENAHGVTEFLQGGTTTRGRATAFEVQSKTEQGLQFFSGIVDNAQFGLEGIFEKIYNRTMQFKDDWSDPAIQKIAARFGMQEFIKNMNPIVRYRLMKRPFRFHTTGLNAAIKRAEMLKNLTDILSVLGNFGEIGLAQLDLKSVFEKIFEAFDFEELMNKQASNPNVIVPGPVDDQSAFPGPALEGGQLPPNLQQGIQQVIGGQR